MARSGMSRRDFLRIGGGAGAGLFFIGQIGGQLFEIPVAAAAIPGGTLDPADVPEVPDADADPAGDAEGRNDRSAGRQAGRLLRDLGASSSTSRSCRPGSRPTTVWGYGGKSRRRATGAC